MTIARSSQPFDHSINYNYLGFVTKQMDYLDLFAIYYHYFNWSKSMVINRSIKSIAIFAAIKTSYFCTAIAFDFDCHSREQTEFGFHSK